MLESNLGTFIATRHYDLDEFLEKSNDRVYIRSNSMHFTGFLYPNGKLRFATNEISRNFQRNHQGELTEFVNALKANYDNIPWA